MQDDLFGAAPAAPAPGPTRKRHAPSPQVRAVPPAEHLRTLAGALPAGLRMGVSTWSYPGWDGLVWDGIYDSQVLSRKGLGALSQHPLMRTVCVDRSFWRPLTIEQYAQMANQVDEDFQFMVKCPNVVTDALVRSPEGRAQELNPRFLDPNLAVQQFVLPAVQGLGSHLGVLVYQLSPLPWGMLCEPDRLFAGLRDLLDATQQALHSAQAAHTIVAVEVRDPLLLEPKLITTLRAHHATLCLGLHGKMPPIEKQLPWLRQLWPTPLVCRWNLNTIFGPYGYAQAQDKHEPFHEIRSPDVHTRAVLARTIDGICGRGQRAFVTISNDAEGCAPRSIALLAQQLRSLAAGTHD